jgi:peptidoglycan hydrolase-like protein with peptidoglycan-binding domain
VPDNDARVVCAPEIEFRRSLRASRERRKAVARRRRRVLRGRRGLALALSGLAIAAGGALADEAGPAPAGGQTVAVQKALGIPADGIYGPQTRRAVRRFQKAHGLQVDGVAGAATLAVLGVNVPVASDDPTPTATATDTGTSTRLEQIAQCESGGNPAAVSSTGQYRGKYQFDRATWERMGGTGDPAAAPEAEQDRRAAALLARQGPSAWPNCAS